MCVEGWYVQDTLIRQYMTEIRARAERSRLLHSERPPRAPRTIWMRVSRLLRRPQWRARQLPTGAKDEPRTHAVPRSAPIRALMSPTAQPARGKALQSSERRTHAFVRRLP